MDSEDLMERPTFRFWLMRLLPSAKESVCSTWGSRAEAATCSTKSLISVISFDLGLICCLLEHWNALIAITMTEQR